MIFIIVIMILVIGGFTHIALGNSLKLAVLKIGEAESSIDVCLTKRFSTLTKMLDVTKQYTSHEREMLLHITTLRESGADLNQVNKAINDAFKSVQLKAEAYPELRSSEVYIQLQKSVNELENDLSATRRFYNSAVTSYNYKLTAFPTNLYAAGYEKKSFFDAEEDHRADVSMRF